MIRDRLAQRFVAGPPFKGKWILVEAWGALRGRGIRKIGGGTLELDLRTRYECAVWGRFEEEAELGRLRSLLGPGDTFIDCGANIGLWTLSAAELVGPMGRVVAVEPHPVTFQRLAAHVATLPHRNVQLVNRAADSVERSLQFDLDSVHNTAQVGHGRGRVNTVRLDDVVDRADGIKIDVEGHELEVLRGAERLLRQHAPWICIEYNTDLTETCRPSDWAVHQHLASRGYSGTDLRSGDAISEEWTYRGHFTNLLYSVVAPETGKPPAAVRTLGP